MSRRVGIGIVGLGVLLAVGAFVCGLILERVYGRIIEEAVLASEGRYDISGEYRRGWLSSSANTLLVIHDEEGGEPLELPFEHDVVHGPVPLAMLARGGSPLDLVLGRIVTEHHLDPERLPRFAQALDGQAFFRATARIGPTGVIDLLLHSPKFELEDGAMASEGLEGDMEIAPRSGLAKGRVRLGPLHLREEGGVVMLDESTLEFASEPKAGEGASGVSETSGVLTLGAVTLEGEQGRVQLAPSRLRFEGESGEGASVAGKTELELAQLEAHPSEGRSILVRGLALSEHRSVAAEGSSQDFRAAASFDSLELGNDRYGRGELAGALRNIDAGALASLREAAAAVEAAGSDPQQKMVAQMAIMNEQLPAFLSTSPQIALEAFELTGESGTLEASARLGVDGSDPSMLNNPFMLISAVQGAASLEAPGPMLAALLDGYFAGELREQQPELDDETRLVLAREARVATLDKLTADGTLIRSGDRYTLVAELDEGLPIINGAPADPTFLMGILPGF